MKENGQKSFKGLFPEDKRNNCHSFPENLLSHPIGPNWVTCPILNQSLIKEGEVIISSVAPNLAAGGELAFSWRRGEKRKKKLISIGKKKKELCHRQDKWEEWVQFLFNTFKF